MRETDENKNGKSEKGLVELIEWVESLEESLEETPVDYAEAAKLLQKNRKECAEWLKGKDTFWIVSEKGAEKMRIKITEIEADARELRESNTLAGNLTNLISRCFQNNEPFDDDESEEEDERSN